MHQGRWEKLIGRSLAGATALVVGFGRIGRRVADLLSAFGAEVLVADPFLDKAPSYPVVGLSDGLRRADLVSLHASGRDVLIGEPEFGEMKDGAILLNAARGGLVDEQALLNVLRTGRLRGAWFDVFWNEPYTGDLRSFDQVLLTLMSATSLSESGGRIFGTSDDGVTDGQQPDLMSHLYNIVRLAIHPEIQVAERSKGVVVHEAREGHNQKPKCPRPVSRSEDVF